MKSIIAQDALVHESAYIGDGCVIGKPSFQSKEISCDQLHSDMQFGATQIGMNSRVFCFSVICSGTVLGQGCRVDYHSFIGQNCVIGDEAVVEYGARVYDRVKIGKRSSVSGFLCNETVVGKDCNIQGSTLHRRTQMKNEKAPQIMDRVLVGRGAQIVGNLLLEDDCIIAAGAVLTKNAEAGYVYSGVPATRTKKSNWF